MKLGCLICDYFVMFQEAIFFDNFFCFSILSMFQVHPMLTSEDGGKGIVIMSIIKEGLCRILNLFIEELQGRKVLTVFINCNKNLIYLKHVNSKTLSDSYNEKLQRDWRECIQTHIPALVTQLYLHSRKKTIVIDTQRKRKKMIYINLEENIEIGQLKGKDEERN